MAAAMSRNIPATATHGQTCRSLLFAAAASATGTPVATSQMNRTSSRNACRLAFTVAESSLHTELAHDAIAVASTPPTKPTATSNPPTTTKVIRRFGRAMGGCKSVGFHV